MKKLYFTSMLVATCMAGMAQNARPSLLQTVKTPYDLPESARQDRITADPNRAIVWSSDFSNAADWTVGNTSTPAYDWEIVTGISAGLTGQGFDPTLVSTSGGAFGFIDSDTQGSAALQNAWLQTAAPIDLSSFPNVIIQWQQYFRHYQDPHYVEVSNDGGANWTSYLVNNIANSITSSNPNSYALNISASAGGQASVLIRFRYEGNYGWFWAIDDVEVRDQPADDLINIGSYASTVPTLGLEYGRIPVDQLGDDLLVGSSVFNFGFTDQSSISLDISIMDDNSTEVYANTVTAATIAASDTLDVEATASTSVISAVGRYEATYTVESANEQSGASTFGDNSYQRAFEVTDAVYSLDGIDNHPAGYQNLTSLGSNSFTGAADGVMFFTMYNMYQPTMIEAIQIVVTQSTTVGGSLIVSIHDTATVLADDIASPLVTSDIFDITSVPANGVINVSFTAPFDLASGAYYVGVELFSNDNADTIRIVDDITVVQPWYGSMFYNPGDATVYSNGEAMAIRMVEFVESIQDQANPSLFNIAPNPSNGLFNINFTNAVNGNATINVYSTDGRLVVSNNLSNVGIRQSIDLSGLADGLYSINVQTSEGFNTVKVIKAGN